MRKTESCKKMFIHRLPVSPHWMDKTRLFLPFFNQCAIFYFLSKRVIKKNSSNNMVQ
jgi:hypothetical protein